MKHKHTFILPSRRIVVTIAALVGFEPTNTGIKILRLTTWRKSNVRLWYMTLHLRRYRQKLFTTIVILCEESATLTSFGCDPTQRRQ